MVRNVAGFAIFAFIGIVAVKMAIKVFGFLLGLFFTLLVWAVIGFAIYTLLKIFAPGFATRVRDTIRGPSSAA